MPKEEVIHIVLSRTNAEELVSWVSKDEVDSFGAAQLELCNAIRGALDAQGFHFRETT